MKYRKLTILEIIYTTNGIMINSDVEGHLLKQMDAYRNELMCVSIVVNGDIVEVERLQRFIKNIESLKIAISLTCYNFINVEDIKSLKYEVGQIRISICDNVFNNKLPELFMQLKTPSNNVIFLFEVAQSNKLNPYIDMLESYEFIYNISYSSSISYDSYWTLAKYVSELKKQYPLKVFHEFTCAGIKFNNINGVCPAKTSLMCIDVNGDIKYCFKDNYNHSLNIFDDQLDILFDKLGKDFINCSPRKCNDIAYQRCQDGCPLDMKHTINQYCLYNIV